MPTMSSEASLTDGVVADGGGGEGVQVRLVAGADLQGGGVDLDEVAVCQPAAQGGLDAVARQKHRPAVGMAGGVPPHGGRIGGVRHVCHAFGWRKWERSAKGSAIRSRMDAGA